MSDEKKSTFQSNRITVKEAAEQVVHNPDVDVVAKSREIKNGLYGAQYQHGGKYVGAGNTFKDRASRRK